MVKLKYYYVRDVLKVLPVNKCSAVVFLVAASTVYSYSASVNVISGAHMHKAADHWSSHYESGQE